MSHNCPYNSERYTNRVAVFFFSLKICFRETDPLAGEGTEEGGPGSIPSRPASAQRHVHTAQRAEYTRPTATSMSAARFAIRSQRQDLALCRSCWRPGCRVNQASVRRSGVEVGTGGAGERAGLRTGDLLIRGRSGGRGGAGADAKRAFACGEAESKQAPRGASPLRKRAGREGNG